MSILDPQRLRRLARVALREEDGQIIPWVLFMMFFFLGMCALTVDIGHAMLVQRELQASADAAALAAAQRISNGDWKTYAANYSAQSGKYNQYTEYGAGTPTITGYCSTTVEGWLKVNCTTSNPVNAVVVTEQATVPMFFTQYINIPSIPLTVTATAAKGNTPEPFNVAIILDTTPSMNNTDSSCTDSSGAVIKVNGKTATQLQCATIGVQQLLIGLDPSVDYISLFTFPNVTTSSLSADTDCSSSTNPYVTAYTFPGAGATSLTNPSFTGPIYNSSGAIVSTGTYTSTYQVTSFLNDYRSSTSSTTLSSSSVLANAAGYNSSGSCSAMQTSYENTYYAAAIYAAQDALLAEQATRKAAGVTSGNAIILLSDGDATAQEFDPYGSTQGFKVSRGQPVNCTIGTTGCYDPGTFYPGVNDMATGTESGTAATSSGTYPSWNNQCQQGITAAQAATTAGTLVFTIAYGSPTSGCSSDGSISPCYAMQYMSSGWPSDTSHFFSDDTVSGSSSGCASTNGISDFDDIFQVIVSYLSRVRLIPNGTA